MERDDYYVAPGPFSGRRPADTDAEEQLTNMDGEATLKCLLEGLPPAAPTSLYSAEMHHVPEGNKDIGWKGCLGAVEKHDRDLCQAYREQIDTLLVFAGLFSAVVTAFTIESYQWLQADPADTSVELLRDVVSLLAQNLNKTSMAGHSPATALSDTCAARINVFWFLSLSLSLSAALVAILCKQWLREFERDVGQSPETALAVRHIRFQGLEYWNVGSIVTSVPILLQVALALFLIGIMDFLWQLHVIVASCVTVVAGATLLFYLVTTFLPLAQYVYICQQCMGGPGRTGSALRTKTFTQAQCAFKSAQAWLAVRAAQPVIEYMLNAYAVCFTFHRPPLFHALVLRPPESWVSFDMNWVKRREHIHHGAKCAYQSLAWVARNLEGVRSSSWIWHCVWSRWIRNRDNADDVFDASLDIQCVSGAYPSVYSLDVDVSEVARAQAFVFQCSLRSDLSPDVAIELILRVAPHVGVDSPWTDDALRGVRAVYRDVYIHLSDDTAMGLFRLAQLQTNALVQNRPISQSSTPRNGASAFYSIWSLLRRGARARDQLMPAMCALTVQWSRAQPPEATGAWAKNIIANMIVHYVDLGCERDSAHRRPGVIFAARLDALVASRWPDYMQMWLSFQPAAKRIHLALLALSESSTRNANADAGCCASARCSPQEDEAQETEMPGNLAHFGAQAQPSVIGDLPIDGNGGTEMGPAKENGKNWPVYVPDVPPHGFLQ